MKGDAPAAGWVTVADPAALLGGRGATLTEDAALMVLGREASALANGASLSDGPARYGSVAAWAGREGLARDMADFYSEALKGSAGNRLVGETAREMARRAGIPRDAEGIWQLCRDPEPEAGE